jgi:hypothetical protein
VKDSVMGYAMFSMLTVSADTTVAVEITMFSTAMSVAEDSTTDALRVPRLAP